MTFQLLKSKQKIYANKYLFSIFIKSINKINLKGNFSICWKNIFFLCSESFFFFFILLRYWFLFNSIIDTKDILTIPFLKKSFNASTYLFYTHVWKKKVIIFTQQGIVFTFLFISTVRMELSELVITSIFFIFKIYLCIKDLISSLKVIIMSFVYLFRWWTKVID